MVLFVRLCCCADYLLWARRLCSRGSESSWAMCRMSNRCVVELKAAHFDQLDPHKLYVVFCCLFTHHDCRVHANQGFSTSRLKQCVLYFGSCVYLLYRRPTRLQASMTDQRKPLPRPKLRPDPADHQPSAPLADHQPADHQAAVPHPPLKRTKLPVPELYRSGLQCKACPMKHHPFFGLPVGPPQAQICKALCIPFYQQTN